MSLIIWGDNLSVNVKEIDDQHCGLIILINKLHGAMQDGKGKSVLKDVLDELAWYTGIHFATEERYMQDAGYPGYADHKMEHDYLTKQVMALKEDYESGTINLTIEVSMFLNNWLQKHIMGSDKAFAPYLNSKGIE